MNLISVREKELIVMKALPYSGGHADLHDVGGRMLRSPTKEEHEAWMGRMSQPGKPRELSQEKLAEIQKPKGGLRPLAYHKEWFDGSMDKPRKVTRKAIVVAVILK